MRTFITLLLTVVFTVGSFCQNTTTLPGVNYHPDKGSMERTFQPGQNFPDYPRLTLPDISRKIELPAIADNSSQPFLRPVFIQYGAACGQSSSVAYNFCYEINRLRNLPSNTSINQYPDHFVWNFMNATLPYYGEGVSYFHTFDILYDAGNPTEDIYGPITMDDSYYWMNGYNGYLQAMHNRISGVNSIHVGTPEGLLILKHWLHNHLDGSAVGGLANYYAGMPYDPPPLAAGTPEAGKHVQTAFLENASHALAIVGYNDSIRFDVNGDGHYTNNLDINGDGIVDMQDWEIGGLKYVNSYGNTWADSGFCYMLYRTLAIRYGQGGIWNNSVHVIYPDTAYRPLLTIKATLQHNKRGRIRLTAGVSADTARFYPEHTLSFSVFNYQGGDFFMAGNKLVSGKTLELGLDISPLLSYVQPGSPARFFLIVDEDDPDSSANGLLLNYTIFSYLNQDPEGFISTDTPLSIVNNGRTIASVVAVTNTQPIKILPDGPVIVTPETPASVAFSATGGYPPYTWKLNHLYTETGSNEAYTVTSGDIQVPTDPENGFATIPLPFGFPYYGEVFDTLYMHVNGYLMFDRQDMPYFYQIYDAPYLRQIKAIAGYMNRELALNSPSDYMTMTSSTEKVTFNWRISAIGGDNGTMFSISVFPDGHITCHYGASLADIGLTPVIGISNGTRSGVLYSNYSGKHTFDGQIIGFTPAQIPPGISLSESGILNIIPGSEVFSGEVEIQISDANRLKAEKHILLTTGPEIDIRVADSSQLAAPGSIIPMEIEIRNKGSQAMTNLSISLATASGNAFITGSPVSGIIVLPGESTILQHAFALTISDTVSTPQNAMVIALLSSGSMTISKYSEIPIVLPVLVVSPPVVADGDNLTADPGEEAPLLFNIFNYGNASAGHLTTTIAINDPYAAINGNCTLETGELKSFSKKVISFKIKVNQAAPTGRQISVNLNIRNEVKVLFNGNFILTLGQPAIVVADLDKNRNSAFHIFRALNQLNTTSDLVESIDTTLLNYKFLFLSLGFFPQNHVLNSFEDSLLVEFLNQGGRLYLEGGTFFNQDPLTVLRSRLRIEGSSLAFHDPADTLIGIAGSPAEGILFDYLGDWMRGENLLALPPALPWFRDKNSGLDFVVALDSGYYRTITSAVEFGGTFMYSGPGRTELLSRYLDFLGYNTAPLAAVFKPDVTQICRGASIRFNPVTSGSPTSYHWIFDGGTPSVYDGPSPEISYDSAGIFLATLTISDSITSNTFTLDNLITVDNCIGIDELPERCFMLYPNPASEFITLETALAKSPIREVSITDLLGRNLLRKMVAESKSRITIPISELAPGIYIVVAKGEEWVGSSKLVIK